MDTKYILDFLFSAVPIYVFSTVFNYFYFRHLYKNNRMDKEETIGSMIGLIFIPFLNTFYAIFIIFSVYFSMLYKSPKNNGLDGFFVLTYEEEEERDKLKSNKKRGE